MRVAYGPEALELLASGVGAAETLARLTAADPGAAGRQLAIVDAHGAVAAHTGAACMDFAGHVTGDQVSCQANIMANATVWSRMMEAFSTAAGPLASRLLAALDAAEAAGGDIRGRQSAALLVVPAEGESWETTRLAPGRGSPRAVGRAATALRPAPFLRAGRDRAMT